MSQNNDDNYTELIVNIIDNQKKQKVNGIDWSNSSFKNINDLYCTRI